MTRNEAVFIIRWSAIATMVIANPLLILAVSRGDWGWATLFAWCFIGGVGFARVAQKMKSN